MTPNELRARLRNVYWLGGGSGAGKTTIARRLATHFDLDVYSTDDAMADHGRRCPDADCPSLAAFREMDMEARWVDRSPEVMLETFHWFRGEAFHLIVEDLLDRPADRGVVVEGFRLLPRLVAPCLFAPSHALWLLPTPAFRKAAFESRGTLWSIAGQTSDKARALDNLLERDRLFTERLRADVESVGLTAISVDSPATKSELERRATLHFEL